MPTSRELVPNKPLSGEELATIIKADLASVLAQDCMLTPRVAYGRVSYEIRVTLHMDNPMMPSSVAVVQSKLAASDAVEARPELAALNPPPPLPDASDDATVYSTERHRDIVSPNVARIEHGMPISVIRPGRDTGGNPISVEEGVIYPPDVVADVSVPPRDIDLTRMAKAEFAAKERR
jgi:hypothetical protein